MAWRILIADDSLDIRSAVATILHAHENWVVCGEAANGLEAVELAVKNRPDMVLLDFQMPHMNGLDAATEILKTNASLPIVLYSLHQISVLERHAKRIGITKVISKSDVFTSLIETLEEILPAAPMGPGTIRPE